MENKLDFSLPQKKTKNSAASILTIILLLVLIGLVSFSIFKLSRKSVLNGNSQISLTPTQMKELASRLAQRSLYTRAVELWKEYLANANLTDIEQAKGLFQIATLYEKANMYEEAIEYFYRSEITSKATELESQINSHIKDCFEKLGKFSALRYELMDRTSFNKEQDNAGSEIVAEIGPEKIAKADLDSLIEQTIDIQLMPLMSFMTQEQRNEQKKQLLEQYKTPAAKMQFLQSWLAQEALYRDALEQEIAQKPEVKIQIEEMTRQILSQQLMNNELADKINITETDLQTYYQANKDKYVEPAKEDDPNSVPRQKTFNEVREQVTSELVNSKSRDVQQALIKQLMDKYNIIVHTSEFTPAVEDSNDM